MIEVRRVSKYFGKTKVLSDFSFSVPDGQTYALLGLSGSGKTTALKLVCGLHQPEVGEIQVQGIPVQKTRLAEVRAKLGYVIQDGGLFPHMTAYENLSLVGEEGGWTAADIKARVEELAALTKISSKLLRLYPGQLSGGQRQRVGVMRALFREPPILLLDEPFGALDPITRRELQMEFKALCKNLSKTVLLVTHDLYEAAFLADRILLLNQGFIVQQGSLVDLVSKPADEFVRRFVESHKHHVEIE
ncbi:MAG: ATP-binding cassette domain-containing protein [Bdellovibrionales bacterium]